jgi:uncharacterized zinc-type alcohol dehydrogenase-like protein
MAGVDAIAMACPNPACCFKPMHFKRRAPGDYDVQIAMKYCGVCHSDLHFANNDLGNAVYPMVPGHELAGVCVSVGKKVTKFAKGDHVGVGCFVDSCLECSHCQAGEEQYCTKGCTFTYGAPAPHGRANPGPGFESAPTYGGYSTQMVIHERFAIKIPKSYPLEKAGPLMCAAITMYDPLKHFGAKAGTRVGIMGLGGLGTMGVKLAKALGCHVTVISRAESKRKYAMSIGADNYIAAADATQMAAAAKSLDLILDTISASHPVASYLSLLDINGSIIVLGICTEPFAVPQLPLIFGRNGIHGSVIGGIASTQEVVDLCAAKNIYPETKVVPVTDLNVVYEALSSGNDSGIRYVLDIANTLNDGAFAACADLPPPKFASHGPSLACKAKAALKQSGAPLAILALGLAAGALLARRK